jgi:hypothetical protein
MTTEIEVAANDGENENENKSAFRRRFTNEISCASTYIDASSALVRRHIVPLVQVDKFQLESQ